jgi:thioester reductase-like protein
MKSNGFLFLCIKGSQILIMTSSNKWKTKRIFDDNPCVKDDVNVIELLKTGKTPNESLMEKMEVNMRASVTEFELAYIYPVVEQFQATLPKNRFNEDFFLLDSFNSTFERFQATRRFHRVVGWKMRMLKLDEVLKWEIEMEDQLTKRNEDQIEKRMKTVESVMEDRIEKPIKIVKLEIEAEFNKE